MGRRPRRCRCARPRSRIVAIIRPDLPDIGGCADDRPSGGRFEGYVEFGVERTRGGRAHEPIFHRMHIGPFAFCCEGKLRLGARSVNEIAASCLGAGPARQGKSQPAFGKRGPVPLRLIGELGDEFEGSLAVERVGQERFQLGQGETQLPVTGFRCGVDVVGYSNATLGFFRSFRRHRGKRHRCETLQYGSHNDLRTACSLGGARGNLREAVNKRQGAPQSGIDHLAFAGGTAAPE